MSCTLYLLLRILSKSIKLKLNEYYFEIEAVLLVNEDLYSSLGKVGISGLSTFALSFFLTFNSGKGRFTKEMKSQRIPEFEL